MEPKKEKVNGLFLPPKLPIPGSIQSFFLFKLGSIMDVTILTRGKAFVNTVSPT